MVLQNTPIIYTHHVLPVDMVALLLYDRFGHSSSFLLVFDDEFNSDVFQGM
jgi:hypothetical protein